MEFQACRSLQVSIPIVALLTTATRHYTFAVQGTRMTEKLCIHSQMMIRMTPWHSSNMRYFGELSTFIDAVESPTRDTSLILSSFQDAVKTYDLTWYIREASEASTRELRSIKETASTALGTSSDSLIPASLEDTTTASTGPTLAVANTPAKTEHGGEGLVAGVTEGVETLGLGSKKDE